MIHIYIYIYRGTCLELGGDRVLVHVDVVFVDGSHDEFVTFRLHPRGDEGGQVQPRVSVQHQLVVYDLVRRFLRDRRLRHPEPAHVRQLININNLNINQLLQNHQS